MELIQGRTAKGNLTECVYVIDGENAHCFSYGHLVASIIGGEYVEFETPERLRREWNGKDLYNSRTTRRHKNQFRKRMGIA